MASIHVLLYGNADEEIEQYCGAYSFRSRAVDAAKDSLKDMMKDVYLEEEGYYLEERLVDTDEWTITIVHPKGRGMEWYRIKQDKVQ